MASGQSSATAEANNHDFSSKVGARFTKESVRILKAWLAANHGYPYLHKTERQMLQQQTGLTETQISNWLANARRRGKLSIGNASPSPSWSADSQPVDVPLRPSTPAFRSHSQSGPLQRWVDSPPEDEPASALAIARAMSARTYSTSGSASPILRLSRPPSAGSIGTSRSSSASSVNSHTSHSSFSRSDGLGRLTSRRRRRGFRAVERSTLHTTPKAFPCTFCTETFRAKHDWQRHERSLHLSVENWQCCPNGPLGTRADNHSTYCVFCGHPEPDTIHFASHNYSHCDDRSEGEKSFNRKDHLHQHLRLVHNAKFEPWMRHWKTAPTALRSRCGFCEQQMETWSERVEHLANHFKNGKVMADWKGDWGFEPHILEMVDNSIPPYFIETERKSPFPFEASRLLAETPRTAYELLKVELAWFMQNHFHRTSTLPRLEEMQLEACRIIFASETNLDGASAPASWLRDLVFCNTEISQQARFGSLRTAAESRLPLLEIGGKGIFRACPFEKDLSDFIGAKRRLDLMTTAHELREECCRIVACFEDALATPVEFIANFFIQLMHTSDDWTHAFRQRHQPLWSDLPDHHAARPDACVHDYSRLERELSAHILSQRSVGLEPDDTELRQHARVIVHASAATSSHHVATAADDDVWLQAFHQRHNAVPPAANASTEHQFPSSMATSSTLIPSAEHGRDLLMARSVVHQVSVSLLNDTNYMRWFTAELRRWVATVMSPHNPSRHVPSDDEIQHYARCISYDNDDPFNQTIAEHSDWLRAFKHEMGIESVLDGQDAQVVNTGHDL